MRKVLPPKIRDAVILSAMAAVLVAVVRPALVAAQGTINSQLCIQNVRNFNLTVDQYTQDYDEVLPPLNSPTKLAVVLQPYTTTPIAFLLTCPLTKLSYNLNTAISGKPFASLPTGTYATFLIEDSVPHIDGQETIGYLSGAVTYGGVLQNALSPNAQCISNEKQIGLAVIGYTQDYDGTLPVYRSLADLQKVVLPYTPSTAIFSCPVTSQPYIIAKAYSGESYALIPTPAAAKYLKDARPHPDGVITSSFLDGHVAQVGQ